MGNSDILLEDDQLRAIKKLLLTVEADEAPNVTIDPSVASARLGGGSGDETSGEFVLADSDGGRLVHLTGKDGEDPTEPRAFVDGSNGEVKLSAETGGAEDIFLKPEWGSLFLGGGGSGSDGDIRLKDRDGETSLHLDGGGNGVNDDSTNVYVDADTGSIHARPKAIGDDSSLTHPLLYLYNHWEPSGQNWRDYEQFPSKRPIIAKNEDKKRTGLTWDNDGDRFLFQGTYREETDLMSSLEFSLEQRRPLTVDLPEERVGIRTDSPEYPLHVDGKIQAANVDISSDARYKSNVEGLDGPDALEAVQQLRGVRYEWNDDASHAVGDGEELGFLAQEVQEVLPESVTESDDGDLSLSLGSLTPVLVEAIKDQQAQVEDHQETIEDLRDAVDEQRETIERQQQALAALEARVETLESDDDSVSTDVTEGQ